MTKTASATIAVIGTAISGLSSAIGAANAHHQVTIFGRPSPYLPGALQLAPNGFAALDQLGAIQAASASFTRLCAIELRSARTNSTLSMIDHEKTQRAYASIGRDALYQALLSLASAHPAIRFEPQMVSAIHTSKQETSLITEDGSTHHFDLIIGADGKDGIARRLVAPALVSSAATRQAIRAACASDCLPRSFATKRTQLWLGDGYHLVCYPFDQGKMINLVLCTKAAPNRPHEIIHRLTKDSPVLSAIAAADLDWQSTPLTEASMSATWRKYGLILTGDAAHFMPPHLAQGAGQTLEDAASLSKALKGADNLQQAASQWSVSRSRALSPIIARAEATGTIMRLSGPLASLRNIALELGGQKLIEQWLQQVWQAPLDPLDK